MLYAATYLAPALTTAYHIAGFEIGSGMISYVTAGLWPNVLIVFITNLLSVPGLLILTVIALVVLFYVNKKDTFNKLGYKAKINTHTTSYIN